MRTILILAAIFTIIFFSGCSKSKRADIDSDRSMSTEEHLLSPDKGKSNSSQADKKDETVSAGPVTQKLIRNGDIAYNVDSFDGIESGVTSAVKQTGGYIYSSNSSLNSMTIQVKIPSDRFDDFLKTTGTFGKIYSKIINVEDVTMNFYDLENRIKTKRILQQRYQSYLSTAKNTEELLKIERELNNITSEIESIEGQFRNLTYLISYSTLTMNFYIQGKSADDKTLPSISRALKNFWYSLSYFMIILLIIILSIIGFGTPLILLTALFYYVTFGKLGLVKKLFVRFSGK